jgi:uncharacterized membrane protein YqjE
MPEPTSEDPPKAQATGLFGHFSAFLAAKLAYWRARLELAGIEGKEAAVHLAIILGLAIGAVVVTIAGYFLFVIAVVFLIAKAFSSENAWMYVLGCAALVHFAIAAALLIIARIKLGVPLFPLTLEELKKDQEWLKTNAKPH